MKHIFWLLPVSLFVVLVLAACASPTQSPTAAPAPGTATVAPTADPCSADRLRMNAVRVNEFTRLYDDAYQLASSTPRDQLAGQVARLQEIRRGAQDQAVPICLAELKQLQLNWMNAGIDTMLKFLQGTDKAALEQALATVQQARQAYVLELARLLGVTVVPAVTPTPAQ